jgi:hypothetical protein
MKSCPERHSRFGKAPQTNSNGSPARILTPPQASVSPLISQLRSLYSKSTSATSKPPPKPTPIGNTFPLAPALAWPHARPPLERQEDKNRAGATESNFQTMAQIHIVQSRGYTHSGLSHRGA